MNFLTFHKIEARAPKRGVTAGPADTSKFCFRDIAALQNIGHNGVRSAERDGIGDTELAF